MSKNKNGEFNNLAAKKFKDVEKIDLMSQQEIFKILDGDVSVILEQITASRNHTGRYPQYAANAFANLSTCVWLKQYVKEHCKITKKGKLKTDLSKDELESLRAWVCDGYKRSATNQFSRQTLEFEDRMRYIQNVFAIIYPKVFRLTKKLKLDDSERKDLTIQVYGDPTSNFRFVHKLINASSVSNKKKIKILRAMYGKRFEAAVGAAMTIDSNNSDCLSMLYDFMMGLKTKDRAPIVYEYAKAFKRNKTYNFRLKSDGEFYRKNKRLIKELRKGDIGMKKAFKPLRKKKNKDFEVGAKKKSKKEKTEVKLPTDFKI